MSRLNLNIVINCGPFANYIANCLQSVKLQTYSNWRACVTIDPCGDNTFEKAVTARGSDARISIVRNHTRMYSMVNLVHAIRRSHPDPEDVIVVLDGDDWLYDAHALETVVRHYTEYDPWMTYGSWIGNTSAFPGRWPAYPKGTTDFRNTPWLGTALRTWKKWLWDLIDPRDFKDAYDAYFRVTEDQAVMLPMLEMSGTDHAKHIPDVLMLYNRANPHCCGNVMLDEMRRNAAYLRSKKPYKPLREKPSCGQGC